MSCLIVQSIHSASIHGPSLIHHLPNSGPVIQPLFLSASKKTAQTPHEQRHWPRSSSWPRPACHSVARQPSVHPVRLNIFTHLPLGKPELALAPSFGGDALVFLQGASDDARCDRKVAVVTVTASIDRDPLMTRLQCVREAGGFPGECHCDNLTGGARVDEVAVRFVVVKVLNGAWEESGCGSADTCTGAGEIQHHVIFLLSRAHMYSKVPRFLELPGSKFPYVQLLKELLSGPKSVLVG